jgi:hypothetical protein
MTDDVGRVLPQGTGTPVTIPGPIFAAAVHTFVAGQRLDMRPWPGASGWPAPPCTVGPATGNSCWTRCCGGGPAGCSPTRSGPAHLTGTDRLTAVIGGVLRAIGTDRPVRMFLDSDLETALRAFLPRENRHDHGA